MLSGGLDDARSVREAFEATGAEALMLARGALGNPWLFEELLRGRERAPGRDEWDADLDGTSGAGRVWGRRRVVALARRRTR